MKKGFTLIELIAVVVLFGIFLSLSIPIYNKITKHAGFKEVASVVSSVRAGAKYYDLKCGIDTLPADETAWGLLKVDKPSDTGTDLTYTITSSSAGNPALQVSYSGSTLYEYDLVTGVGTKTADPDAAYLPADLP